MTAQNMQSVLLERRGIYHCQRPPSSVIGVHPTGTDQELMEKVKQGDKLAFDAIFDRYHQRIYGYLARRFCEPADAEDIVQEVFARVFKGAQGFDTTRRFSSWLYGIASNEGKRYWKLVGSRRPLSLNKATTGSTVGGDTSEFADLLLDEHPTPPIETERLLLGRTLAQMILQLPRAQREVLMMRVIKELSFQQISEATHSPISTVLSRMRYALIKLRAWSDVGSIAPMERN